MTVIAREVAEAEVKKWLDHKKVFEQTREDNEASIKVMVESIENGVLVLNPDTHEWTHNLLFPFSNEQPLTSLTYKARLNDSMMKKWLKGVDATDGDARVTATICALTETARGIIDKLDSLDKKISLAIAVFFY